MHTEVSSNPGFGKYKTRISTESPGVKKALNLQGWKSKLDDSAAVSEVGGDWKMLHWIFYPKLNKYLHKS